MKSAETLSELTPKVEPSREHHWEGMFDQRGDEDNLSLSVVSRLLFQGGLVEGAGNASLTDGSTMAAVSFTLAGERAGDGVSFRIWLDEDVLAHPLECSGMLDAEERRIEGDWSYQCMDPVGCNCSGGGGTFRLERVNE